MNYSLSKKTGHPTYFRSLLSLKSHRSTRARPSLKSVRVAERLGLPPLTQAMQDLRPREVRLHPGLNSLQWAIAFEVAIM